MDVAQVKNTVLEELSTVGTLDSLAFSKKTGIDHSIVDGAVKSLLAVDGLITVETLNFELLGLSKEGHEIEQNGSHEYRLLSLIPEEGISQQDLMQHAPWVKVGFSKAMSNKWILTEKSAAGVTVKVICKPDQDTVRQQLLLIVEAKSDSLSSETIKDLKKRKLIETTQFKYYNVSKGAKFTTTLVSYETDLTADLIAGGGWATNQFKPYNFEAIQKLESSGHLHPLLKVRTAFRNIFLRMGYEEMPTNRFAESSFWNFDSLFQPQQHPARDSHDTFFLSSPAECPIIPEEYCERVRQTHENGGTSGSVGYRYNWKLDEAKKNILRTHTTAVSARVLKQLADDYNSTQNKVFTPKKYFSIDRVYRNETMDATHLAEFHQIEGLVADYDLTLGDLIGTFKQFFSNLGMDEIRFKPAYNPYTEPSMEIFSYHKGLKRWVEVGNSGVFRPEMLEPMGFPKDVSVIAWGLSLERPTMIMYEIDNIRELVGHKVSVSMVKKNPLCIL